MGRRPLLRSAWLPAALVLLVYVVWLVAVFDSGFGVRDFIHMGRRFVVVPHIAALFAVDPHYHYAVQTNGYDGQFSYYIALAPVDARLHLDWVSYRYTRILYPMTARAIALGHAALIPYVLILINLLAIGAGTLFIALWLKRHRVSPWFAVVYGLSPGLFICLHRDLEEPLAFALVAAAMYLYSFGGRRFLLWSAGAFALAALTRESTALFPVVLALYLLFGGASRHLPIRDRRRWSAPALLLAIACGPWLAYKAFLVAWLGLSSPNFPSQLYPQVIPFAGLLANWPWRGRMVEIIASVVLPAMLCAAVGVWAVRRRGAPPEVWLLLANVQLFVVMLNPYSYITLTASARITTGVLLTALLCIPAFDRCTAGNRTWLWCSIALWFVPWPSLLPFYERLTVRGDLLMVAVAVFALWLATERVVSAPRQVATETT